MDKNIVLSVILTKSDIGDIVQGSLYDERIEGVQRIGTVDPKAFCFKESHSCQDWMVI